MPLPPLSNDTLPGVLTKLNRGNNTIFTSPAAATAVFSNVTNFALGTDIASRIGRLIRLKLFEIRAIVYQATVPATATHDVIRMALIYDFQPTGVVPVVTDVYISALTSSLYAYNSSPRFRIIREWFMCIGTITTPGTSSPSVSLLTDTVNIDLDTVYSTTAFPVTGALYFMYSSATGNSVLDCNVATYYEDK